MTLTFREQEEDKRHNRRVGAHLTVGIAVAPRLIGIVPLVPRFQATIAELSVPGMQIISPKLLRPHSKIVVWVTVDPEEEDDPMFKMKMKGRVVWSKPNDNGEGYLTGIHLSRYPKRSFATWQTFALACIKNRNID